MWLQQTGRRNVMVHIVQRSGQLYPVNWLRNLVIRNASTEYILMNDADFIPSKNLMSSLQKHFSQLRSAGLDETHAVIVPAFEMLTYTANFPANKRDVIAQEGQGQLDVFHRKWHPAGHRIWQYDKWKMTNSSYKLPKERVCSEPEPYVAVKTSISPYFPEVLLERGKNKVAYHFELCIKDFQFVVLADGFLVHKMHAQSAQAGTRVDRCVVEAWAHYRTHLAREQGKSSLYKSSIPPFLFNVLYVLLCILLEVPWLLLLGSPLLMFIGSRKLTLLRQVFRDCRK